MRKRIATLVASAALVALVAVSESGGPPAARRLPEEFAARARHHIEAICAIGPRPAGSPNEGRTAAYIADQFLALGIIPIIEPFPFETFEPDGVEVRIADRMFLPAGLGLDPYSEEGSPSYSGEFFLLDPSAPAGWPSPAAVVGKAVVTSEAGLASLHFRIAAMRPACIIYATDRDFSLIGKLGTRTLSLSGRGRLIEGMSRNVIARLGAKPPAPQIVVGAHLDAYRDCPGANDNASGIAALLEIARHLKGLGVPQGIGLTFVAFGAEEAGILGSRRFVERHGEELKSCRLALVLDNLGGEGPVSIERDGGRRNPSGDPGKTPIPAVYRGRSWEGLRYRWKLIPTPALYAAIGTPYHPAWLIEAVDKTARGLGFAVQFTEMQGSDQMTFAQAGIATSGISAPNVRQHTPDDGPETVVIENVRRGAEAACGIIQNVWSLWRSGSRPENPVQSLDDPMAHVRFLASDELGGRRAGSREGEIAADYVRACLRAAGVAAFFSYPDYFQDVALPGSSPSPGKAPNVVGFIRGSDPERADEFVALVAHYDHLGRKSENGTEVVYPGARDNALGVAAVLSAAKELALNPPSRSILVLATTAEEEGMIGSRFFVEHPPIPLARIVSVLNNDGAGVTRPGLWCISGLESFAARPLAEAAGRDWGLTSITIFWP